MFQNEPKTCMHNFAHFGTFLTITRLCIMICNSNFSDRLRKIWATSWHQNLHFDGGHQTWSGHGPLNPARESTWGVPPGGQVFIIHVWVSSCGVTHGSVSRPIRFHLWPFGGVRTTPGNLHLLCRVSLATWLSLREDRVFSPPTRPMGAGQWDELLSRVPGVARVN